MKRISLSLKSKVAFGVCLLVVGMSVVLGYSCLSYFQVQLKKDLAAQQLVLVSSIAGNIDDNLLMAEQELASLAKRVPVDALRDAGTAQRFLDGEAEHRANFENGIMLYSREGALVAESPFLPGRRGKSFSYPAQLKIIISSGKPSIAPPHLSLKPPRYPVVTLNVPVFNAAGEVTGVLAGGISLIRPNFLGNLVHTPIGRTGYLYLFDTDRTIIMHPDQSRILAKDVPVGVNKGFDAAVAGFEGAVETVNSRGLPVLVSFKHLSRSNWILAANYPQSEAYAAIGRARRLLSIFPFVAIPLFLVVIWFYIRRQTAPLQRFTDHIRLLSCKQGNARFFDCASGDEIGVLAQAFNSMLADLDSERKAMLRSEVQLNKAQRLAKMGSWEANLETGRVHCSEEMFAIAGLGVHGFDSPLESYLALVHPDERAAVELAAREALLGIKPFALEHRLLQPCGQVVTVQSIAEVFFDEQRRAVRAFGTLQDITDKKQAEHERQRAAEELRESEERFRQFSEHCKEVFFVVSSDLSRTEYVNPAYETIWQQSCKSLYDAPMSFADIIHQDDRPRIFDALERQGQGEAFDQTYRIVRSDSSLCWIHARTYPITADSGEVYRYAGIAEDVTQQKIVEEQIRKMQQAVEQSPVCIVITDRAGTIEYVNPRFSELTGYLYTEAVGQNPRILKSGAMPAETYRDLWGTILDGREWHGEILNKKKNGELIWESAHLSPIRNSAGEITHFLGVKENITERKAMEEELRQSKQSAEEANRLKSQFLANMSHEIRTPMNGVIGMTDLLVGTELDKEQREYVQAVKSSAESLLSVINQILDFSKIEAGKLDLEYRDFELRRSLGDFLQPLALQAAEKGIELAYRVHSDVPDALMGDPGRLRQIIVNLVSNALKFTARGEVVLSVNGEQSLTDEALLHFSIADTGIGIPEEKRQHIFEPFSQADGSTTREYGGTGLGLTISDRLVAMMGGRIWLESETGTGSVFHFTARCGLSKGASVSSVPVEPADLQDLRVLVVDDNAVNRLILEELLTCWRMRPAAADSGRQALQMIAQARQSADPFSLLLIDVNMPQMDGFELVSRLKQGMQLDGAVVMMFSSAGRRSDAARCRELGISSYLSKPVGQSALLDALLTAIGKAGPAGGSANPAAVDGSRRELTPLRVLLAEDNPINQRIAVGMLEKRGHAVVVTNNGKEAVAAMAGEGRHAFDLVLMDVQMPEMGGFEATALIRALEEVGGGHIPIIALTAHAIDGYRDICLNAGMDSYLAKPIKTADLFLAIEQVLKVQVEKRYARRAGEGAFDHEEALSRLGGDLDLYREAVEIFQQNSSRLMAEIWEAIAAGDPVRLSGTAHSLRGSVSYLGARVPFEIALKLEMMGDSGEIDGAGQEFTALEEAIARLTKSVAVFVEQRE